MKTIKADDISAVILAGGRGSRMGGRDKGLVPYQGKALVSHVVDAVRLQLERVIINANRSLDEYAQFGCPVISDSLSGYQGPLAGFLAAMQQVETDFILTLPCDGPIILPNYAHEMLGQLQRSSSDIVVASDGEWMQPVYALIPVRLKDDLEQFLAEGERKIDRWYARHNTAQKLFHADSGFFTNINTLEELEQASDAQ